MPGIPPLIRVPTNNPPDHHVIVNMNNITCVDNVVSRTADQCVIRFVSGDTIRVAMSVDDLWNQIPDE